MVNSSFFTDGPDTTGEAIPPAAPSSFYADPAAAASSAAQAAASATQAAASAATAVAAVASTAGTATPLVDGTATVGTSSKWAHEDHVHPTDTTRAPLNSPALTGAPTAPTPANADNSTKIATTAWVQANTVGSTPASAAPLMNGTAAVGVSAKFAREDHVHPTDSTRAPLANPVFTGTPTAPTPTAGDSSLKLATTAFVATAFAAGVTSVTLNDTALSGAVVIPPVVQRARADVAPGMAFNLFSDSIGLGTGASTTTKFGWPYLLTNRLGLTFNNYSSSGKGSNYATKFAFTNQAKYGRRSEASAWMSYHNDIFRGGASAATIAKIKGELRSFLANSFLASAVPINDASVTKTGTWTAGLAINEKAVTLNAGAGRLMYSTTVNDTLTWTFTGDSLVVGLFNTDGTAGYRYGTASISVDGAASGSGFATFTGDSQSDGINDGVYDNKITHNAVVLTGLGTGSHTVILKVTGNTGPVYVDYFGTLAPQIYAAPVLVAEATRPNAAGYSLGGGVWTPAAFDTADAAVRSVLNEFYNFPVTLVKTNNWFNSTTGISADNEHPNDLGHAQIAAAFQEGIAVKAPMFIPTTLLAMSADQSLTSGAYNAVSWGAGASPDDNRLFAAGSPTRVTMPFAGVSRFEGHVGFASNATGIREAFIFKNGSPLRMIATSPALSGDNTVLAFSTTLSHAAGDYFELQAIQSSGGALNCASGQTQMSVTQIR